MPALTKRHITLWVVLLLAVLSFWIQRQEEHAFELPQEDETQVLDFSMADFEITAMDDEGKPKHRLQGKSMVHYLDSEYAELVQPRLEVYAEAGTEPMSIDAELAKVYQNGDSVLLQGEVKMHRLDEARQSTMEVQTRDVWVYTEREYAETSEKVTITDKMGVTTGTGMQLDMKAGTVRLLASVRGKYVLE